MDREAAYQLIRAGKAVSFRLGVRIRTLSIEGGFTPASRAITPQPRRVCRDPQAQRSILVEGRRVPTVIDATLVRAFAQLPEDVGAAVVDRVLALRNGEVRRAIRRLR